MKRKAENEKKVQVEEIKGLSWKEVASRGNINPVVLILADCDIKEYLNYRIMLIENIKELEELKEMYKNTEWWAEAINNIKGLIKD